ncbi:MAG: hypothetical protein C5B49_15745 [Bdellovibrio sp.]|nr:MAG: hypothetical protein C5B49_15745 [Bdellovibrio sp.]
MPDNWNCKLEQTEWVCRSDDSQQAKEAVIILTAKEVGPMDSYEAYVNHLNTPQQVNYGNLGVTTSRIVYPPKKTMINNQLWIDGLHMGSEVPSYFTRYLTAIKNKIAVLITFSAHRDKYTNYTSAFFKAVQSLRVTASANMDSNPQLGPLHGPNEMLGQGIQGAMPGDLNVDADRGPDPLGGRSSGSSLKTILLMIALLLAAGGIYVFLKSREK